jgi:hypothetical protein
MGDLVDKGAGLTLLEKRKLSESCRNANPQTGQAVASALPDCYIQTPSTVLSKNRTIQSILKYLNCGWHIKGTDSTSEAKERTKNPKLCTEE